MIQKLVIFALVLIMFTSCKQTHENQEVSPPHAASSQRADLGELYKYYHSNPTTLDQKEENLIIEYLGDKGMSATRTKSGVYIHISKEGTGEQVKWGDPLSVDYKGYFLDGRGFDSSYERGEPISFRVGNMNAGWNEALPFLKRGSMATLLIPSHMGYGQKGFPGYVDPNTIILFDVDIKDESKKN